MDPYNTMGATVGRFGVDGQMSAAPMKLVVSYIVRKCEAAAATTVPPGFYAPLRVKLDMLAYDGENCNFGCSPRPGAEPSSLHALALQSQAKLDALKGTTKADGIVALIKQQMVPRPLPANVQHVCYLLVAPTLPDAGGRAQLQLEAARREAMAFAECARRLLGAGLLRRAGASAADSISGRFVRRDAAGAALARFRSEGEVHTLGPFPCEQDAVAAIMQHRQIDFILDGLLLVDVLQSGPAVVECGCGCGR